MLKICKIKNVAGNFNTYELWELLVSRIKGNLHNDYSTMGDEDFWSDPYDYFDMELPD